VQAQGCRRRCEERGPALSSEQSGERGGHDAVGGGVPRTRDLAAQHRQLVPQYSDLDVLLVGSPTGPKQREQPANEDEGDRGPRR
jgi:hypothetical protein